MKDFTDYQLVQRCLNGEKEYFEEIVKRNKSLVYSIVFKMVKNKEDANDLTQEVFIKIYQNLNKYLPNFKLSSWIIRITTNHVIDYIRKDKYEIITIQQVEYKLAFNSSPEKYYIEEEEKELINILLNGLSEIYRIPLVLYHKHGLSYKEISNITKEPLSKIKNRIFKGRKILREEFLKRKEGFEIGLQQS